MKEKRGELEDPVVYAKKLYAKNKLKTVVFNERLYSPSSIVKSPTVSEIVRNEQKMKLILDLKYQDYVLFHRMCLEHNMNPTNFISYLVMLYDIGDENLLEILDKAKDSVEDAIEYSNLTDEQLYSMIEAQRQQKEVLNGSKKEEEDGSNC